ncbi:Urease operon accessory protein [Mycobacterium sp. KBS0706]|nr:Urease operon accessory protein [Mycobacterium sp. KBS0706]
MTQSIVIVGNGPIGARAAARIATAEIVVRFNECRSFPESPGRTDVVAVCNTGRPGKAMLSSTVWRTHPAVVEASEIWCVRDPDKFARMRGPLAVTHPELDDFCDDYTEGFARFAAETGKMNRILPGALHESVDAQLAAFDPPPYVVPSSGLIVLSEVVRRYPGDHLALAGFTHEGWEWHPFSAERSMVDGLIAAGRLQRLQADDPAAACSVAPNASFTSCGAAAAE